MGELDQPPGADGLSLGGVREAAIATLVANLERLAERTERATKLFWEMEDREPASPLLRRVSERLDRLMTDYRVRVRLLAGTPAETLDNAFLKSQALRRYCDVDIECDPQSCLIIHALCDDVARLKAVQDGHGPGRQRRGPQAADQRRRGWPRGCTPG